MLTQIEIGEMAPNRENKIGKMKKSEVDVNSRAHGKLRISDQFNILEYAINVSVSSASAGHSYIFSFYVVSHVKS